VFRTVIGTYEDRQNFLMSENGHLRTALSELQKELIAMLHSDDVNSTGDKSGVRCCSYLSTGNCCYDYFALRDYFVSVCHPLCVVTSYNYYTRLMASFPGQPG